VEIIKQSTNDNCTVVQIKKAIFNLKAKYGTKTVQFKQQQDDCCVMIEFIV